MARIGPDTEIRSHAIVSTWRKIKENGGKWGEFRLCTYCGGSGVKLDRLKDDKDKTKTQECKPCRGWGFVRLGGGKVEIKDL